MLFGPVSWNRASIVNKNAHLHVLTFYPLKEQKSFDVIILFDLHEFRVFPLMSSCIWPSWVPGFSFDVILYLTFMSSGFAGVRIRYMYMHRPNTSKPYIKVVHFNMMIKNPN